ncbi:MAG: hypothetical protein H7A27_07765 [Spirochaetaceae bacterium]|nr:hypothetical protein [Spirochaetaceae bacterium]
MALSISIEPGSLATDLPVALRRSLAGPLAEAAASARFLHPDALALSATLTVDGVRREPLAVSPFDPDSPGPLEFGRLPVGSDCSVSVSISDADGLLCSGSSGAFVVAPGGVRLTVSLKPLESSAMLAGPHGDPYGVVVDASLAGRVSVFSVALPVAGPYDAYFGDYDNQAFLTIYDPDGAPIPTTQIYARDRVFNAARPGGYYAVLNLPADYTFESDLGVDADTRVFYDGPAVYVDEDVGYVMDRQRGFSLSVPCGFAATPAPQVTNSNEDLFTVSAGDRLDIEAGENLASSASSAIVYVAYTDAMLGISRTSIQAERMPSPRSAVYVHSSGTGPADSLAPASSDISSIATLDDTVPSIVLLRDGDVIDEGGSASGMSFSYRGGLIIGGCDESWERRPDHAGRTSVRMPALGQNLLGLTPEAATPFIIDSVDFETQAAIEVPSASVNLVYVGGSCGDVTIRNSSFRFSVIRNAYAGAVVSLLASDSAAGLTLDRTEVSVQNSTDNAYAMDLFGVRCDDALTGFTMIDSVVSLGAVSSSSTASETCAVRVLTSSVPATVVGSTVSGGVYANDPGNITSRTVYIVSDALRCYNNLLVIDTSVQNNYAITYYSGAQLYIRNNLLATVSDIDYGAEPLIRDEYIPITNYTWDDFVALAAGTATNACLPLSSLAMAYDDPLDGAYLMPTASSPAALRTGGANLGSDAVIEALSLSAALKPLYAVDRVGAERTGSGDTGYTIGAYEQD